MRQRRSPTRWKSLRGTCRVAGSVMVLVLSRLWCWCCWAVRNAVVLGAAVHGASCGCSGSRAVCVYWQAMLPQPKMLVAPLVCVGEGKQLNCRNCQDPKAQSTALPLTSSLAPGRCCHLVDLTVTAVLVHMKLYPRLITQVWPHGASPRNS